MELDGFDGWSLMDGMDFEWLPCENDRLHSFRDPPFGGLIVNVIGS